MSLVSKLTDTILVAKSGRPMKGCYEGYTSSPIVCDLTFGFVASCFFRQESQRGWQGCGHKSQKEAFPKRQSRTRQKWI